MTILEKQMARVAELHAEKLDLETQLQRTNQKLEDAKEVLKTYQESLKEHHNIVGRILDRHRSQPVCRMAIENSLSG